MADRFQFRSIINDSQQAKEGKPKAGQMEKDCNASSNGGSVIHGQFQQVTEFPATIIQKRRNPSEEAKQDQIMGSTVERLEYIDNSEHVALAQASLETDVSLAHWRATLKLQDLAQKVWFLAKWSLNWHLTCSNQRESTAIPCALHRSVSQLKEKQIKSLQIVTDNSSAAYNINRGSAAIVLAKLVDRTLETTEVLNLQLHAFHIPGVTNRISDSLS
ncbi:MAG: hypothetical protein EZS28_032265 [Streblomastix strix]|uniref:Uncharacterized protein n=1 Tax=Streblomastix strix TaxID=222440 RepID=A0A5J4UP12_9EUKA|nr:MAG: hypothetical protein EZS28_032265 [Streblomastix strix]